MNGFNIWPDLAMAAKKPALVIINQNTKEVKLVELTVAEINGNGFKCSSITLEISTRGVVNTRVA